MERKIGETFEFEGKKLKVVQSGNLCGNCYFSQDICKKKEEIGECISTRRTDRIPVIFVEVKEETKEQQQEEQLQAEQQPQKLNLCEVLRYCPKGEMFYSTVLGYVSFEEIIYGAVYPIIISCKDRVRANFTADGKMMADYDGECTLFPSKEQRSWADFIAPWYKKERFDPKTLKPFDKIIFKGHGMWFCGLFSHIHNSYACIGETYHKCVIPYNDDTKHLVGTRDEAPEFYKYWED